MITETKMDFTSPIPYIKINLEAIEPTKGSSDAAGFDLYIPNGVDDIIIEPNQMVKIDTGIGLSLPKYTFGGIFPRSGLSTKKGLRLSNCVGVIDSDYRGSIIVPIYNDSNETQILKAGERIAQLIVIPFLPINFNLVNKLEETERGKGGFGSTGE